MLNATELIGFGVGGGRGNTAYGLTDTGENDTNQTTYTFSSKSLGPADDSERWIFVSSSNQATANNSSGATWTVTIGGNAMTEVTRQANGSQVLYLHVLKVSSGSTADIVVTMSTAGRGCAIAVYAVYGNVNTTPVDTQFVVSTTLSDTITTVDGGWMIAGATTNSGTPADFTGTGVVTDFSAVVGTSSQCVALGSAFGISGTSLTYGHAFAGSSEVMMGVSFGWN